MGCTLSFPGCICWWAVYVLEEDQKLGRMVKGIFMEKMWLWHPSLLRAARTAQGKEPCGPARDFSPAEPVLSSAWALVIDIVWEWIQRTFLWLFWNISLMDRKFQVTTAETSVHTWILKTMCFDAAGSFVSLAPCQKVLWKYWGQVR